MAKQNKDTASQKPKTPEVETPEVETPEVETPEVETPEVETPEVETPEVETPEVETPEVETPEVETPEVETPIGDILIASAEDRKRQAVERLNTLLDEKNQERAAAVSEHRKKCDPYFQLYPELKELWVVGEHVFPRQDDADHCVSVQGGEAVHVKK